MRMSSSSVMFSMLSDMSAERPNLVTRSSSLKNIAAEHAKMNRKATTPMPILTKAETGPPGMKRVAAECFQFQLVSVWAESMMV